jgi:AcrR family transcriptional regulator
MTEVVVDDTSRSTAGRSAAGRSAAGRPRDVALDEQILTAALSEIAERGIAGFSSVSVARRAGVAKNTVYLRWPKRDELIKAALLHDGNPAAPTITGDLRRDLRSLADEFAAGFASDIGLASYYQLSVTSRTDPEMWAWGKANIIDPAHAIPERVIIDAQRRGTARADVDAKVLARLLVGGIFAEAILQTPHGHVSESFREHLVDTLIAILANDR